MSEVQRPGTLNYRPKRCLEEKHEKVSERKGGGPNVDEITPRKEYEKSRKLL